MSMPPTTVQDLAKMGVTKESVAKKCLELGEKTEGELKSLNVGDGGEGLLSFVISIRSPQVIQPYNYLVSDWVVERVDPPRLIANTLKAQSFDNFTSNDVVSQSYHRSHTVTKTIDYTLTKSFDVSVNANIPLGQSGAALGVSATMSESDVKHESTSETQTDDSTFSFPIPAGEGMLIEESIRVFETTTRFRARIGLSGTISITCDPGLFDFGRVYRGPASVLAPDAGTDAYVTRTDTSTEISTSKIRMTAPGVRADVVEVKNRSYGSEPPAAVAMMRSAVSVSLPNDPTPSHPRTGGVTTRFVPNMPFTVHIHFSGEIAKDNRRMLLMQLVSNIVLAARVVDANAISRPSFQMPEKSDDALITFSFDNALTTRPRLQLLVATASNMIAWGGSHMITF